MADGPNERKLAEAAMIAALAFDRFVIMLERVEKEVIRLVNEEKARKREGFR